MDFYNFFHQHLQLSRAFVKKLNELIEEYNLKHPQLMIINYLKEFGPSTLVDIAGYLNVEKSSITRTVNRLERNGLVEQVPGKDKREKRIKLSKAGLEVQALCRQKSREYESYAMRGIAEKELASALQVLLKIKNNLNENGDR